jgi:putative spermidine/putrescine transport system permease protein
VAPALALVVLVTGAGLTSVVAASLGLIPLFGTARLSLDGYTSAGPDLTVAVRETVVIAVASTLLATALGLLIGTVVLLVPRHRWLLGGLAAGVVTVPHLVGAASVALLIGDTGLLPRVLGIDSATWPHLVGGRWPVATVTEFAWKESAFVALVVVATVGPRLGDLLDVARVLGAGPWQRWWRVLVPSALPALLGAALIVFVYTVGSYDVAWLLGRAYPEPLPVMSYRLFGSIDLAARPQAAASAVVGAVVAIAAVVLSALVVPRRRRARDSQAG